MNKLLLSPSAFLARCLSQRIRRCLFPGTFVAAGFPIPQVRYETVIGVEPNFEGYEILASAVGALMPQILKFGIATAEEIEIETLAERLREEHISRGGVTRYPGTVLAWVRTGA